MRAKIAMLVTGVLVVGFAWFWLARDTRLPAAPEDAMETALQRHEQPADSQRVISAQKPPPPSPSQDRTALAQKGARSPSAARRSEGGRDRRTPARRDRASDEEDSGRAIDDGEVARGSEDVARIKQLLEALRNSSGKTPRGDPRKPIATDLRPEDVGRLDLDGDQEISPWELEQARRLVERAENHPVKNDLGDGAYPVHREEYRRQEWEFDAVDTNQDDVMDVDEFHAFLVETERISVLLDRDGDRQISFDESGLSPQEFAPLDRDDSGALKAWEIRRAVALEALD